MSKQIYDELVAAGAPELPEGYRYKISREKQNPQYPCERSDYDFLVLRVLYKRRDIFGDYISTNLIKKDDTIGAIVELACNIDEEVRKYYAIENLNIEHFVGTHP